MKRTLTTLAVAALALTGCGASQTNTSQESPSSSATSTSAQTPAPSPEATEYKAAKIGESQAYKLTENDATVLQITVEKVEAITADQCTTSYFDGVPVGKQLIRLSVSAEAGTKESIEAVIPDATSINFWASDWGWVDSEGYKIQSPHNRLCISDAEEPAKSLAPEQKTRGQIILEVPEGGASKGAPYYEAHWAGFPLDWEQ